MDIDQFLKKKHSYYIRHLGVDHNERRQMTWLLGLAGFLVVMVIMYTIIANVPPRTFPVGQRLTISEGTSLTGIAETLKEQSYVRSATWFKVVSKISGQSANMKAGDYVFEKKLSTRMVVRRIAAGEYGDVLVKITIPEGSTNEDIARIANEALDDFDATVFMDVATPYTGYLFPETYFVLPSIDEESLVDLLHTEFSKNLLNIAPNDLVSLSEQELRDTVIMASIIEKEARDENDAFIISGILWKRIEIDMPLQVDATFAYLLGKASHELTRADLQIESPYNTYENKGLPPGPISNPGAVALDAALNPADSPYLFYLHAPNGDVHYGKNHNEHVNNKNKYLK